jgi:hypothetical protein
MLLLVLEGIDNIDIVINKNSIFEVLCPLNTQLVAPGLQFFLIKNDFVGPYILQLIGASFIGPELHVGGNDSNYSPWILPRKDIMSRCAECRNM